MTVWTYLALSAAWSAVGALVGYFVGRSTVAADAIAHVVRDEGDAVPDPKPARRHKVSTTHAIGAVVIVLGVFTAVQSFVQSSETERLTQCQTAYANGFADALEARSEASAEAQTAQDDLWTKVAALTPTPESREVFRAALNEYLSKRAAAKRAQQEHPFPDPPRDVC